MDSQYIRIRLLEGDMNLINSTREWDYKIGNIGWVDSAVRTDKSSMNHLFIPLNVNVDTDYAFNGGNHYLHRSKNRVRAFLRSIKINTILKCPKDILSD